MGVALPPPGGATADGAPGSNLLPPAAQNLCPDGSVGCQEPAPTMVIVIAGLCVMLFLIAVALLLLFYSFYKYRRQARVDQVGQDVESGAVTVLVDHSLVGDGESYDGALLVVMPGEDEPRFFARPSTLPEPAGAPDTEEEEEEETTELEAMVHEVMESILKSVVLEAEQLGEAKT